MRRTLIDVFLPAKGQKAYPKHFSRQNKCDALYLALHFKQFLLKKFLRKTITKYAFRIRSMTPRPLELFDLPKLPQFRAEIVSLDCARILTRGNPLRAVNFLAHFNPTRRIYTAIHESKKRQALLGSIRQQEGERFARLTYLAPLHALPGDVLPLLEHLLTQAKHWQVRQVVAEIEEDSPLFQALRQSGFSVYARQRVWDLSDLVLPEQTSPDWRRVGDTDQIAIQSLQRQIVPPLLQQIENFDNPKRGLICRNTDIHVYVDVRYGARGIFLRPLIHPDVEDIQSKLQALLARTLVNRREKPVYFCVRSYQAWLESTLEALEASVGPRLVVMVKHLAKVQRLEQTIPRGADAAWANPASPIQSSKINGKESR